MKLLNDFATVFHFSVVSSYININAGINVNADNSISSFTFNEKDNSFAEPVNRVLLKINSSTIIYTALTLLRTSISKIST
jgi:hypothetical protein